MPWSIYACTDLWPGRDNRVPTRSGSQKILTFYWLFTDSKSIYTDPILRHFLQNLLFLIMSYLPFFGCLPHTHPIKLFRTQKIAIALYQMLFSVRKWMTGRGTTCIFHFYWLFTDFSLKCEKNTDPLWKILTFY